MQTLFKTLIKTMPGNENGRDFVVGDLHGQFDEFQVALKAVGFDKTKDRVFSVGDLADRGPKSFECLELLLEPWFFAVRGNHEQMLMQYLAREHGYFTGPRDFYRNGGNWLETLSDDQRRCLFDGGNLGLLLQETPLMIQVGETDTRPGFNVIHTGLHNGFEMLPNGEEFFEYGNEGLEGMLWHRRIANECLQDLNDARVDIVRLKSIDLNQYDAIEQIIRKQEVFVVDQLPKVNELLTYVGHNVLPYPLYARGHVFLDTGAGYMPARDEKGFVPKEHQGRIHMGLTLVEHGNLTFIVN